MARAVTGADFQNHEPPATLASAQGNRPLLLQRQEAMKRQQVPDGSVGDEAGAHQAGPASETVTLLPRRIALAEWRSHLTSGLTEWANCSSHLCTEARKRVPADQTKLDSCSKAASDRRLAAATPVAVFIDVLS